MKFVICGQPIEEGRKQGQPARLAKYCLNCRAERRRRAKLKYTWQPEYDAYLKARHFGGLTRRFQVLSRMVRMTGLPRWYTKRQAAQLGLTMRIDRRPWTSKEIDLLEKLVCRVSSATIAKRLRRPENSVVNKMKRLGTSRRVRNGYTMRELELCLGEDHHKIAGWIKNGWLQDRLQGTRRHDGNGNDMHRLADSGSAGSLALTALRKFLHPPSLPGNAGHLRLRSQLGAAGRGRGPRKTQTTLAAARLFAAAELGRATYRSSLRVRRPLSATPRDPSLLLFQRSQKSPLLPRLWSGQRPPALYPVVSPAVAPPKPR